MKHLLLTTIAAVLSSTVLAAPNSIYEAREEVQKVMTDAVLGSDLPSVVAVGINAKGQRIVFTYGGVNWDKKKKVTTRNLFRIHSMTKLVTSIAAMQLVEQGKLELDKDLSSLMPEMASIPILTVEGKLVEPRNVITLRHA